MDRIGCPTERKRGMRILVLHHLRPAVPALGDEIGGALEVGFNYDYILVIAIY